jgi:hypothetical protein
MLPADIHLTFDSETPDIELSVSSPEIVLVGSGIMGPQGPPGPEGQWLALTQAEYDALSPPDPETLYVIIP